MYQQIETRTDRRRARSRAALIDAARRVTALKGGDATSLRDIAAAADLGLGTFYNYFASKAPCAPSSRDAASLGTRWI